MISIILKSDGSEKRFCFTKRSISLGPKGSQNVDIPLPIESSVAPYALIEEHNGRYTIQNLANDPHLKFNNLPFGRRTLVQGSVITVHGIELSIDAIDEVVEDRITPEENEKKHDNDLALLMQEVESLEIKVAPNKPEEPQEKTQAPSSKKLYWISTFTLLSILFITTIFTTIYFSNNVKSEEEELKAGKGVADVAMALLYAQLHNIKPTNNNWADPKFLDQILSQIIPKTTSPYSNIDAQGNFKDFPYILRVYTNDDASRFLLLAQPRPNFMSWFQTKDSVVIESTSMELRKIQDIQPLNRIIFNAKELNNTTIRRISTLVKEGALIPLNKLDHSDPVSQFSPPAELQMLIPGAQNFVYNAPRYYKLTEPILADALDGEVTPKLLEDLKDLMQVPHLIFYTTEGIKSAVKSYKNLSEYITTQKLLVGYFTYSPTTHLPTKTELLVMNQKAEGNRSKGIGVNKLEKPHQPIKIYSELYQIMTRLGSRRKQALKPITDNINELIHENNGTPLKGFKEQLIASLKDYEKVDLTEQRKISNALRKLYKKNVMGKKEMSPKQFVAYIKATGLTAYVKKRAEAKKKARKYNPLIHADGKVKDARHKTALNSSVLE